METISEYILQPANQTYACVAAFIEELQRAGVRHVVICPGSRSTPLAYAFAAQPGIQLWRHVDERSAAFFGMGLARGSGTPVALVCTSGTAAANFLPALIEARLSHVPLLVLTADRPHELRACGAPQSIDQIHLFGTHVKWFVDLPVPEASNTLLCYMRTIANRAVSISLAIPAGPVHLNVPLREPLTPEEIPGQPLPDEELRDVVAWYGRPDAAPYIAVSNARFAPPPVAQLARLARQSGQSRRTLIIAGPQDDRGLADTLLPLAGYLRAPVLADPLSQLRATENELVITSYDAFLRIQHHLQPPELIIRFGAMPTSKPVLLYLQQHRSCPQFIIDGQNGWEEPTQLAAELIHTDPGLFCQQFLATLQESSSCISGDDNWLASWQHTDRVTRQTLLTRLNSFEEPFEGRVFAELDALLPSGATLFVGNSMPVRDLDTFFWGDRRSVRVLGNRGANGIDGLISTALGLSAASRDDEPVVLVIGDLSFFHDMNGLLAAHLHRLHLTIVLINNDGGGIFSFLPQAKYPTNFEELFGMPLGLHYQQFPGHLYGWQMRHAQTWGEFQVFVAESLEKGGVHIIEVRTERKSNVHMHRQLWQRVEEALLEQQSPTPGGMPGRSFER